MTTHSCTSLLRMPLGLSLFHSPPLPLSASLTPEVRLFILCLDLLTCMFMSIKRYISTSIFIYGPLQIDDFIARWRSALENKERPSTFLFLQPRTGNPLTANSIYQIVSRCCYKYKQKKTNPHLLRDMIVSVSSLSYLPCTYNMRSSYYSQPSFLVKVTHVRKNGDASEKELEALALFMGHSIQMQRDSYDRRTLEQKVSTIVSFVPTQSIYTDSLTWHDFLSESYDHS